MLTITEEKIVMKFVPKSGCLTIVDSTVSLLHYQVHRELLMKRQADEKTKTIY